ncbi:MAG: diaminopimelate epimerase [Methanobacteriaceae archaeon]
MFAGLEFTKMHGLGNDYIILDESQGEIVLENRKVAFVKEICKRGFSVGADGVIFVTAPSGTGDICFRIFNSDGSEAEMCGNGIRCFSSYVYNNKIIEKEDINIETLGGLRKVHITTASDGSQLFKVKMGTSTFKTTEIPMISEFDEFIAKSLDLGSEELEMSVISVGNPHAAIFTDNIDNIDLNHYGPIIENHSAFPQRINVHFVEIINSNEIKMITWERGAGPTYACGTGATSSAITAFKLGKVARDVLVHLPGGDLNIEVYDDGDNLGAYMEGVAESVFTGIFI